jgi:hypothetical protein
MKRILAVGEDFSLLASRAALLARPDATATCCNSAEFKTHLACCHFDLVVLCYSLAEAAGERIAAEVRCRWPEAGLLVITTENIAYPQGKLRADALVDHMEPAQLVRAATTLLDGSRSPLPGMPQGW